MSKLKALYIKILGLWIDDVVADVSEATSHVGKAVDDLLSRAQVDGEDYWFLLNKRKRPSGKNKYSQTNRFSLLG